MSVKEVELEIKKREVELRILRKKLSLLKSREHKAEPELSLYDIAQKYKDVFSGITDEDLEQVTTELDRYVDNWEK